MTNKLFAALIAAALATGCSSVIDTLNPFASKPDPKKLPVPLVELPASALVPKVLWNVFAGSSGDFVFTPVMAGGHVFAASADGEVTRYDQGKQTWRIKTGQALSGGVGSDGKVVVVGTPKGDVLVYSAEDGKAMWTARIGSEVLAPPLVTEGNVVVRGGDSRIYFYDATDGKKPRIYQRSSPPLSLRVGAEMAASPGVVLAGFSGGKLAAININNAAAVWEVTVAVPKGATELERVADVTSAPAANGKDVCAVAYQGRVACFEISSTQPRWAKDMSSFSGLDASTRAVFVSNDRGIVYAYDRRTGASLWKQDKMLNRGLSRPLAVGEKYLVVGDAQGYLHVLKQEDGSIAGRLKTDGEAIVAAPQLIEGNHVLIQTRGGSLYALALE